MSGKVVAVTGGASGIGLETARLLAERGYAPFLLDLKQEALATACAELGIATDRGIACDVTDEASVDSAFAAITAASTLAAVAMPAQLTTAASAPAAMRRSKALSTEASSVTSQAMPRSGEMPSSAQAAASASGFRSSRKGA